MDKIVVSCFDECLYGFYDAVKSGEKTLQQAVEEFLTFPIRGIESVTPRDKAILMQRARKAFRRFEKEEDENEGMYSNDNELYENKRIKISEAKLKSIIRESIEEIVTGGYINQGIDKQWADSNSPLRQFGDDWLRMTLDLCKRYNIAIQPQELISLIQPIATKIMMKKQ